MERVVTLSNKLQDQLNNNAPIEQLLTTVDMLQSELVHLKLIQPNNEEQKQVAVKIAGSGSIDVQEKDADFPSRGALDITAARRDFNFNPKIDIEEGFDRYYQWFKNSEYWKKNL